MVTHLATEILPELTESRTANGIRLVLLFLIALKAGLVVTVLIQHLIVSRRRPPGREGVGTAHVVPLGVSHLILMGMAAQELYQRYRWSVPLGWQSIEAGVAVFLGAAGLLQLLRALWRESVVVRETQT